MKELQLIDRIVVEIKGEEGFNLTPDQLKNMLQFIAHKITDEGQKGGEFTDQYDGPEFEVLFEHECPNYGGFRMGYRSLISDAYYGAKEFFEVCSVSKEDIEQQGFDASKLDADDMQRIASKQGDLINDCCDYWTALTAACEYWNVPRKED